MKKFFIFYFLFNVMLTLDAQDAFWGVKFGFSDLDLSKIVTRSVTEKGDPVSIAIDEGSKTNGIGAEYIVFLPDNNFMFNMSIGYKSSTVFGREDFSYKYTYENHDDLSPKNQTP